MIKIDTAVVLAAGQGKRLKDKKLVKPLVSVKGKPLICHVIDNLLELKIKKIYIIKRKEDCLECIKERYYNRKINIEFITDSQGLGSLYTLSLTKYIDFKWIICSDCDVICNKKNFKIMIEQGEKLIEEGTVQCVIAEVVNPSMEDSNMLMVKNNLATNFIKNGIYNGKRGGYVYLFSKTVLNECDELLKKGCFSMSTFLDYIMQKHKVGTMQVDDMWDVDTYDDVDLTNKSNVI